MAIHVIVSNRKNVGGKIKKLLDNITGKFRTIEKEINKWTQNALNPEIESAFEAIISARFSASIGRKNNSQIKGSSQNNEKENVTQLRHHLLETENSLKEVINSLTLKDPHVLFIDGIDYRPEGVPYQEYIECIKGLAEAVWQLNTDFFSTIRDTQGRIKIVLLVRPDVFHSLNLYNSNSRLQDNTVYLDWSTNEKEYKNAPLYELSGRYFSMQNSNGMSPQEAWEHYYEEQKTDGATFKKLLKSTFQKPRDILTFIKISRELRIKSGNGRDTHFPYDSLSSPILTRKFSDYLLGETRNYSAFYMTPTDFQNYIKFFQYLNGQPRFTYREFEIAFEKFSQWAKGESIKAQEFLRDAESLLQFFYDVNIIGYSEQTEGRGEIYHHWSYRERSLNDIAPKVKSNSRLIINPGISKSLDIGKSFKSESTNNQSRPSRSPKITSNKKHGQPITHNKS